MLYQPIAATFQLKARKIQPPESSLLQNLPVSALFIAFLGTYLMSLANRIINHVDSCLKDLAYAIFYAMGNLFYLDDVGFETWS